MRLTASRKESDGHGDAHEKCASAELLLCAWSPYFDEEGLRRRPRAFSSYYVATPAMRMVFLLSGTTLFQLLDDAASDIVALS